MKKKKTINLSLYCDEVKDCRLKNLNTNEVQNWTYIGILIVQKDMSSELFADITNLRCLSEVPQNWWSCYKNCGFHEQNNTEIHYNKTDNTNKYRIAKKWVDYWLNDKTLIYYYILGIDTNKLDKSRFGPKEQQDRDSNIYNRFFRIALQGSLHWYFGNDVNIIVEEIYHDKGDGENHLYFPWHSIYKIEKDYNNISFKNTNIAFIDSNHRSEKGDSYHSHFIQFIDLILGCYVNCLHKNATNKNKLDLAKSAYKLVKKVIKEPYNKNSRFYKRQSIQFFPRENLIGLDENSLEYKIKQANNFYHMRPLLIEEEATGQQSFFNDICCL